MLSNQLVEGTSNRVLDPTAYGNTTPLELLPFNSPAAHALFEFGRELGAERRAAPGDDLVSKLITAEVEGDHLTDAEFCNFFQLLVFAGNETTRTALSHGLLACMRHPDQLERLHADPSLIPGAVEEIIRWATPVLHMRRTARRETKSARSRRGRGPIRARPPCAREERSVGVAARAVCALVDPHVCNRRGARSPRDGE